jgi:hypothetical protein
VVELTGLAVEEVAFLVIWPRSQGSRSAEDPLSYTHLACHFLTISRRRQIAFAIEAWIWTAIIAGSFVAGIVGAVRSLS